jgi:hypothetical protein
MIVTGGVLAAISIFFRLNATFYLAVEAKPEA